MEISSQSNELVEVMEDIDRYKLQTSHDNKKKQIEAHEENNRKTKASKNKYYSNRQKFLHFQFATSDYLLVNGIGHITLLNVKNIKVLVTYRSYNTAYRQIQENGQLLELLREDILDN